jgi:hypothetical protein
MAIGGGLSMLLKSFGVDPAELAGQVEAAKEGVSKMVNHFDTRLKNIERKQDMILAALEARGGGSSGEPVGMVVREPEAAWKQSA